jgi:hypothetical protein
MVLRVYIHLLHCLYVCVRRFDCLLPRSTSSMANEYIGRDVAYSLNRKIVLG